MLKGTLLEWDIRLGSRNETKRVGNVEKRDRRRDFDYYFQPRSARGMGAGGGDSVRRVMW